MPLRPSPLVARLDRILYPGIEDRWDEEMFRGVISSYLRPSFTLLDVGAGAGAIPQMNFRGVVARVSGIDPDPRVMRNPNLDEAAQGFAEKLPYADASFDVAFSDNVLEHLPNPEVVFREVRRVLRPGGVYVFKTPNRRGYVATIARWTPLSFHKLVNEKRGRIADDTFETLYRANTPEDIRALARAAGFDVERLDLCDGRPEYLRLTAPTYLVGWMIERALTKVPGLARFRAAIIGVLRKTA